MKPSSKTIKHTIGRAVVRLCTCVIIGYALALACTGCEKAGDTKARPVKFEIDKSYERGPLTVHVRLDKQKMTIAETVLLELQGVIAQNYELKMPTVESVLENFGIVDWQNLGETLDPNNNVVTTHRYRLEPFVSGTYAVPIFAFEFSDANDRETKYSLETEPIDIEVTSLLGDQRTELAIADIEGVVDIPKTTSYLWAWISGVVFIVAAALSGWLYVRRRQIEKLVRIFKPAHEIAYERLRALVKDDLIEKGRIKEFYERISDILRRYIEHRFDIRAPERTTEEFLTELAATDVLAAGDKKTLEEFLTHCDLVKFAKYTPATSQIQQTFDLVKDFIEKTKSEERKIDVTEKVQIEQPVETGSV
jgi:hypothetical protein